MEVECVNEVVVVPCVGNTMEKFRILISLFEPKRISPLSLHDFLKAMDLIKLIERRHFERRFIGRERSSFKENIKLIKHLENIKLFPFDTSKLGFTPHH